MAEVRFVVGAREGLERSGGRGCKRGRAGLLGASKLSKVL